ncbi:amino acid permease [Mucilaginibacter rubeus]|uniref:Amino acid permease n=1 Tax=Mucilaginibacter rubeus TaxID=2027860 RepID=A0AAE6JG52_9SPHI|nr:amino acid permease [Mucilaginibacter rubeus]QEM17734.1 amino acid permease [Mucilaginibacter gossypii]QEM05142.1 amino acid permease [Mucilaginibacter rubeus]QTE45739.1 amino acid permease [Mucilaginibacter rubeus]QTE52336.1 amino acid permease [Mucilaginibacter rubeus]QTE57425.1 amino acid permease [Mucilaginibacter rubeus]
MAKNSSQPKMKHELSLLDGTMLVSGSMIGSGIFIVSADITRNVGSAGWLIAIWVITGFMTLTAALSYGELSGMFPKAGGQYVYLKEAYNKLVAFLYGWSFFAVIQTGTIAAVGVAFSKFTAYLIPAFSEDNILWKLQTGATSTGDAKFFAISAAQVVSIILIIILTYVNTRGVKGGKVIQTVFTLTKLISLFGLIIFGLFAFKADIWHANWTNAWDLHNLNKDGSITTLTTGTALGAIAAAMVGSIFSSDAWNSVTFVAGEMKNPKRDVALSMMWGTIIVTFIYVMANVVYTGVLSLHEITVADKDRVAVAASHVIFGNVGTYIIALMIMVSTFGCNNGLILSGARVYYTMAKDGLFFKQTGTLNKFGVPQFGLWIQCVVASLLCLSGRYGDLLDMISFVVVVFYVLTILGIFILRAKLPDAERPYKAIGYPVLPALYIIMGITFCILLLVYKQSFTLIGLGIVLIGLPIYYISQRNVKKQDEALTGN